MGDFESRLDGILSGPLEDEDQFLSPVWWLVVVQYQEDSGIGSPSRYYIDAAQDVLERNGLEVRQVATIHYEGELNIETPPDYAQETLEVLATIPDDYKGERLIGSVYGDDVYVHIIDVAH